MKDNERVVLRDTPDKYVEVANEIVLPFLKLIESIVKLEDEAHAKRQEMNEEKAKMGIPEYIEHPDNEKYWDNYREQYKALVTDFCTKKLLSRPFGGVIQHPARYANAITKPVFFTMKSMKKATLDIGDYEGTLIKHRFILKNEDGVWKIDEVRYGFENGDTWYIEDI